MYQYTTVSHRKTGAEPIPETLCTFNIPQMTDYVKQNFSETNEPF